MITEIRQLIFPRDELIRALVVMRKKRGQALPAGNVIDVEYGTAKKGEITVSLNVALDGSGGREVFTFDTNEIAAALIMHCIEHRIPLPAKANKSLQVIGDSLALVASLNLDSTALKSIKI
jgi:hypothetical protein